jgi:uncharacterized repeat protein (TIGR03803 family)
MNRLRSLPTVRIALVCAALTFTRAVSAQAQTLNYFANFNGANGWEPYSSVVQATDGNFYGAGTNGIAGGGGNMFRMTPTGKISSIYKFCSLPGCADGAGVLSAPVLGSDGNLYGVTTGGGGSGITGDAGGTVFRMTVDGKLTVVYTFCSISNCADGATPNGIILASDGDFYGTTVYGGVGDGGPGVIFKVTPSGAYTRLYAFCAEANCTDGEKPFYPPVQGNNGNFYGVASSGGSLGGGVFYKVTASGKYSVIYNFCNFANAACPDGGYPYAIVKDTEGNFVGTACCGSSAYGVVFKITPAGHYTVLHHFAPDGDMGYPGTPMTLASDGNLYGTLIGSGSGTWGPFGRGGIYEISADGEFKGLHGFCPSCGADGSTTGGFSPLDPLFQGTDGNFYGTTAFGGIGGNKGEAFGFGTAFQFSNGLGPLVQTVPAAGRAGKQVIILGYGLTGTSSVTFNGVAATFTVESDTYIKATVPAGATTGAVSVVTPSGTLNSNPQFVVTK